MRTMKLAVSVYALTLVLGANNALGATTFGLGSASPSCDATSFRVTYNSNFNACDGYIPAGTDNIMSSTPTTWDGTFTTSAALGECLGYEVTGWVGQDLKVSKLGVNASVTNNSNTWKTIPSPDGTSVFALNAQWTATTATIALNSNNANIASDPASLYRRGVELFLDDNYSERMSNSQMPLTSLPQKYGYTFKGYFATQNRATTVGNFWKNGADTYTEAYCVDTSKMPQSEWAKGNGSTAVMNCAWIKSDGHLGNDYVGTAAAKNGTNTLYAAWEPREFIVSYNFNACTTMSGICDDSPKSTTVVTDLTIKDQYGNATETFKCRYGTENCDYIDNPSVSTGLFRFNGWVGTICLDGDCLDSPFADIVVNASQVATSDLSTIITADMWKTIADRGATTVTLTLTARWTKNNTTINFYESASATEPVAVYNAVIDPDATEANKLKIFDAESTETTMAPVLADKTVDGKSYALRGFVVNIDGKSANLANVAIDTEGVPYQAYGTSGLFLVSNADGTFSNKLEHVYSDYNSPMLDALGESGSINVYGIWAQKCDDAATLTANKVATCSEDIGDDASVSYVITCDTGYNLDGYSEINK